MIYKATINLMSPISFTERPVFDALLYYCYMAPKVCIYDYLSPTGREIKDKLQNVRLPLNMQDDFYLCSYAFFGESAMGADSWKKRWHSKDDHLVDFGKAMRRINTASGEYKSYSVPFSAMSVDKVWFYYDTNQPDEVRRLLDNYLVGIGKKVAIGFGWVKSISYEIADSEASFRVYCRPLPIEFMMQNISAIFPEYPKLTRTRGAHKPPYWLPEHQDKILIPEIVNDTYR